MEMTCRARWLWEGRFVGANRWWGPGVVLAVMVSCGEPEGVRGNSMRASLPANDLDSHAPAGERTPFRSDPVVPALDESRPPLVGYHCPGGPPTQDEVQEYSSPPVVASRREFLRSLTASYRRLAGTDNPSGVVEVLFLVDTLGGVPEAHVARTSGHRSLDSAAIRGVSQITFRPAYLDDQTVCMWIALPIRLPLPATLRRED
jgi:TonB family protein